VNVQVIADPSGGLVWASPTLPGAVHGSTAARNRGIVAELARLGVVVFADKCPASGWCCWSIVGCGAG
jgi:hypothetical protein